MTIFFRNITFALFCLLPSAANAFSAYVSKVGDGDTFTVVVSGEKQRVRIFGIDAPEHDQPYGGKVKADLSAVVLGKVVDIEPPPHHGTFPHSYDRIVGLVRVGGTDVGWTLISLGDAWAYDDFEPPRFYDEAETQAARLHIGLWAQNDPMPPWDWRHRNSHHRRH